MQTLIRFPLQLSFRIFAFGPRMMVRDGNGAVRFFIKQKLLRLVEEVEVYADEAQTQLLYRIEADRMIDFNAVYRFYGADGAYAGQVRRRGMRSIWRASYEIVQPDEDVFALHEENPWIKVLDGVFESLPVLNLIAGLVLNPAYLVTRADGRMALRIHKVASLLEAQYQIDSTPSAFMDEQLDALLLGAFMMILLERGRG